MHRFQKIFGHGVLKSCFILTFIDRKSPSKSFGASKSVGGKLEARRQVSAPQIGNQLPEEVRQVYEKITRGQKVTIAKKPDEMPPLKVDKWETSPRLGGLHSKREAFKPASHFSEVRGYENAVPDQKCKVSHFLTTNNVTQLFIFVCL